MLIIILTFLNTGRSPYPLYHSRDINWIRKVIF